jgi:hypothetical protein
MRNGGEAKETMIEALTRPFPRMPVRATPKASGPPMRTLPSAVDIDTSREFRVAVRSSGLRANSAYDSSVKPESSLVRLCTRTPTIGAATR